MQLRAGAFRLLQRFRAVDITPDFNNIDVSSLDSAAARSSGRDEVAADVNLAKLL
jgi:hypothetical protein